MFQLANELMRQWAMSFVSCVLKARYSINP